jgi:hypothetical protein
MKKILWLLLFLPAFLKAQTFNLPVQFNKAVRMTALGYDATATDSMVVRLLNGKLAVRAISSGGGAYPDTICIEVVFDGGGVLIDTTKNIVYFESVDSLTIVRATMLADTIGSAVVQIWSNTYANYPPVLANKIYASAPPTITTAQKSQDVTLTGWTTSVPKGNILAFHISSCTAIKRLTCSLKAIRIR